MMQIFGIETTCDETAASVVRMTDGGAPVVASTVISSQVALHAQWGGVVPNLAAREHTKNLIPVMCAALSDADATPGDIDAIAVANRPGLIPALLTGVAAAKTLAYAWRTPLIGIHHIEGHIYANWIDHAAQIVFPVLALVVSGGHTQIILMRDHCVYDIIGQTHDDAVGEAFDKVARILGLGYPGGPVISARAAAYTARADANPLSFPRPMYTTPDYDFSFSGLKTAVLYAVKTFRAAHSLADDALLPADFVDAAAAAFQDAAVDVLVAKTLRAAKHHAVHTVLLAGGVSANTQLRDTLRTTIEQQLPAVRFFCPALAYCGDNAAMIAVAAHYRYMHTPDRTVFTDAWRTLTATASSPLC